VTAPTRKSARFVTTGYQNALHRIFLYGAGLGEAELNQPFVGVSIAWSEAAAAHEGVRTAADAARAQMWADGVTPREFLVPVVEQGDGLTTRELVADGTELAVRGHWYDGLIGVGANGPALWGLAMAATRLRVPALVLAPDPVEVLPASAERAIAAIEILGLGGRVSTERLHVLACEVTSESWSADEMTERVTAATTVAAALDELWPNADVVHLCAVLHELGVESLAPAVQHSTTGPVPVAIDITATGARFIGLIDRATAARSAGPGQLLRGVENRPRFASTSSPGRTSELHSIGTLLDGASEGAMVVSDGAFASAMEAVAADPDWSASLTILDGAAGGGDLRDALRCVVLGQTTHPGLTRGELAYDSL
jgi:hypothetical protein